jgi:arylsulfatase A-like enzyme
MDWPKLARRGALEGLFAWIVYWSVESFLLHILPRLNAPAYLYMPPSAAFTALLLAIYASAGLLTGAAAGIAASMAARARSVDDGLFRVRPLATLFLCVFVLVSALPRAPRGMPAWFLVLFFLPAGVALLASLVSPEWANRWKVLANPWTAATLLLDLPVLFARTHPTLAAAALWMIPFIAVALVLSVVTEMSPRRRFLPAVVAASLLLPACFLLRQEPRVAERPRGIAGAGKPNVVLVVLDAVRADHLSLYGYGRDTTPNLRDLAAESTVYTNAISPGDMTLSSHASLFTGFYPSWHKAHFERGYDWGRPLDTAYPVLPEILSAKGFDTAAIVANYLYLAPGFGLDRGFQYHDSSAPSVFLGRTYAFLLRERVRNILIRFEQPWQYEQAFRRAEEINSRALGFMDREKSQGGRFFCFLNYMDSHTPYLPPGPYATLFPGYDPAVDTNRYNDLEREIVTGRRPMGDHDREALVSQYDGGIRYMDSALGDLVKALKHRGLYDNTLLIVTADHGEAFGEKALIGHALSVYQDMVHVPMLIKYPGQRTSAVVRENVSLVDLMPTVLDVLGYSAPKGLQGRSLWKAAPENAGRVISESFVHPLFSAMTPRFQRTQQAIFSERWKFIRSSRGGPELYDLSSDPAEEHNLAGAQPTDVLESALVQYLNTAARDRHKQAQARTTTENLEKLKSLGYVQGN